MINESNININFDGGLGENEIPGIIGSKAIFPGNEGPMMELAFSGKMGAVEDFSIVGQNNISTLEEESFLGGSDRVKNFGATRSQSSVGEVDDLTGEIIEEESDVTSATLRDRPEIQPREKVKDSQVGESSFDIKDFFDSGLFTVEKSGIVRVNNLFDGSPWKGEAAIFSLEGIDEKTLKDPEKFIKEAARRALTNSNRGHVIMADRSEGAYFKGQYNHGEYLGSQTFKMKPGDNVGLMFVPNGTVEEVFQRPKRSGGKQPIFSLFTKKKGDLFDEKIIGEFLEDSGVFGVEYGGQANPNLDYKDAVVQLRGLKGVVPSVERLMNPKFNWVSGDFGDKIKDYLDFENFKFNRDTFVVGESGDVKIDFLFDGSGYQGELAVFSLKDFDKLNLRSYSDLIKEAASRASSDSKLGHIVIKDSEEGANIAGRLGEKNHNSGPYLGEKTFKMNPGDKIAFMLVPNGRVEEVLEKPNIGGAKAPLFSFAVESGEDLKFPPHQMVRVEKGQKVFAWEDKPVNKNSDRDFNDLIFSMKGVNGQGNGVLLEDVINPKKDWRDLELADEIINVGQKKKSAEFELMTDRFYSPAESISVWGYIKTEAIDKIDLQLKDGGKWQDISDITEFQQHPLYPDVYRFDVNLTEKVEPGEYQLLAIARDDQGKRLETINQTFTMLSLPEDYVLTNPMKAALEEAIDLDSYNPGVLARTTEWVVSVQAGNSAEQLALKVGAENLGATGHIPNTYIFEFPDDLEASKIEKKLDLKTVEFSYPLVPVNLSLLGIPNDPLFKKQWHLQNTGQNEGTPGVDLNLINDETNVWDKYRGEGVVIATVDDGLQINHPDLKDRYLPGLSDDFNDDDGNPWHESEVVFQKDNFLNFLEGDEPLEFFETRGDFRDFLKETVTDDEISFVLPTSLTGKLENVNLQLEMPKNQPWLKDLEVYLYAPEDSPEHPGTYYRGATYYYSRYWWPGWDDLKSESFKKLNLSRQPDEKSANNSIYKFDIDDFKNDRAGGYWSLVVKESGDGEKYDKDQLEDFAERIRNTWDWSLKLNTLNLHGTAVAGIAAATGNNKKGISGVAPGADLAGLRLIGDVEPVSQIDGNTIANALFDREGNRNQEIDIFNNSWASQYFSRQPLAVGALQSGFAEGRDGLGNNFVFAAGNDGGLGGDINFNYLATSRQTIAVGAVDNQGKHSGYSTPGASLLVSAFSSNEENKNGIYTTDLNGDPGYAVASSYYHNFGGTSAAAPQVTGVAALMLEANPELTGRDVQYILVETANRDRINDDDAGWTEGPADGPRHSHKYGFGLVDAMAAVEAAETWQTVGGDFSPEEILKDNSIPPVRHIPDADLIGIKDAIAVKEMVNTEWVEVEMDVEHSYRSDLEIILAHTYTDPETGEEKTTESILAGRNLWPGQDYNNWTFASARHWGEPSTGTWEVRVADSNDHKTGKSNKKGGTWNSWKLNIYGNSPPTATNLTNTQSYTEDVPLDLEDIIISDKNADNIIIASLTLSNPEAGELSTGTAGDAVSTYDAETGEWSVSGKLEDVNALLAGVKFIPTENYNQGLTIATKIGDPVAAPLEGIITLEGIPVNDPPELTVIEPLVGAIAGRPFTITYEDLLAASDATDIDGDTVSFQLEELLSGKLTKDGKTVAPGEIVLSEGEEIVWTPDVEGEGVEAFSVKAFDGQESSDVAVEVTVEVEENLTEFYTPNASYLSFNDSPFQDESFTYFHLEDFEDGELNTPGVVASSGKAYQSSSNNNDSVDGDDGTIDGSGSRGRSWWSWNDGYITFTFDKDILGQFPTHAGIVVTDVKISKISIEGFDSEGASLGIATNEFKGISQGSTEEDRFLGISNENGISAIKVSTTADTSLGWEVDHLQYGLAGLPTVNFTATDAQASEDGAAAQFVVERTGNTSLPLVVNYSIAGNASNGSDYENLSGTVAFEANATYATIPIIPIRDYNAEGEETVQISLTVGDYELGAEQTATATISDLTVPSTEGPLVHINPSNGHQYLFSEPDTWLGAQEQAEALGGNLVTINDATEQTWLEQTFAGRDYWIGLNDHPIYGNQEGEHRWVSGEVVSYTNWEADEPNNQLDIPEGEDGVEMRENGEWNDVPIDIEAVAGEENNYGIIEIDPATLDQPIVNMVVMDSKAGEDGNVGEILFTRVGKLDEDLTLNYNVAGNATSGSDYQELNGIITIPAGEALVKVPVIALVDDEIEADETIAIDLTAGDYEIGSKHRGQITVIDQHPINRIANEVIGRDVGLLDFWAERWQNGESLEELRPELIVYAVDGAGNLGTELEIDGLYQKIVGRSALPSEIADWRSRLETGMTLSEVSQALGGISSSEFIPTNSYVYTNPDTGNKYFLSTADTWLGAQDQAEALGGNLVTINDTAEGNWLLEKFGPSEYWIGLNDSPIYGNPEAQYQWVSGEEVIYTNWRSDEPSNKAFDPEGEDFGEIKSNGEWNDVPNDVEASAGRINRGIIEISPDGTLPPQPPLPRWTARFINRTWANVDDRTTYDFSNPVAVLDLGPQEVNGKIALKQNWELGSPADGVQNDLFAMEASTRINFEAGKLYKITTQSDDGTWFRLKNVSTGEWTSDSVVLGSDGADWQPRAVTDPPRTIFFKVPETGEYEFYVDYYEGDGDSAIDIEIEEAQFFNDPVSGQEWNSTVFWWDRQEGNVAPTSFYRESDNRIGQINLGSRVRADGKRGITFDWGTAAINNDARLPDNNFVIRSYTQDFLETGRTYRALVRGDDGFQLLAKHRDTGEWSYFTPQNEWQYAYGNSQVVEFSVPRDGYYDFHFHLYEERGNNYFDLSWEGMNFTGSVIATVPANIRSGPSTSDRLVRQVSPDTNLTFDKWTVGEFVDYQAELDTASDIWYRIAGTEGENEEWISAAIVDADPSVTVSPGAVGFTEMIVF